MRYDIEDIKNLISMHDAIAELGIPIVKTGTTVYMKCLKHNEKTIDSCQVFEKNCYCHKCGFHADVIGLYSVSLGKPVGETIQYLGRRLHLQGESFTCPISNEEWEALGVSKGTSKSQFVRLYSQNRDLFFFIIDELKKNRLDKLELLNNRLSRRAEQFNTLGINTDEAIFKLQTKVREYISCLKSMMTY